MENDIKVRKVTQDVVLFVWFRSEIITKKPSPDLCNIPDISRELINNLSITVYWKTVRRLFEWEHFLRIHFKRMTSSKNRFANYVAYGLSVSSKTKDAYDNFIEVLSMVNLLSLFCWDKGYNRFLNMSVELFCSFFEKNIRAMFEKRGGWEHFNEYLEEHCDLEKNRHLASDDISASEYFTNIRDEIEQSYKPNFTINGICIGKVSRSDVETDKQAITFAESVADKMNELYDKEFDEILTDFAAIDTQVKALYKPRCKETSNGTSKEMETFSSKKNQKEASKIIPRKCKSEGNHSQTISSLDTIEVTHSTNINSKDAGASDKESINNRMSISERVKNLLGDISMDIKKLSDMKKSLCKEHGMQVQEQEVTSK